MDIDLSDILVILIGGTIIGLLGKLVAPGDRDNIPLWLTIICGMGGILLGTWLYVDVAGFEESTDRIDWWQHVWQVVAAAVLVVIAAGVTGRRRT